MADHAQQPADERPLTPEQVLQRQIRQAPDDLGAYLKLADLYKQAERWKKAEVVYAKALRVSGGDPNVREKLEDVQSFLREQTITVARARYKAEKSPAAEELYKKLKAELNQFEMDVYRRRTERHPTVKELWAEYALRLQKEGKFKEAVRAYEQARGDEPNMGPILFGLGHCFQAEKQYQLAMDYYKEAAGAIPDSEADLKKEVLYAIGRLAMAMELKDLNTAREYLTKLASMDYAYQDTVERLDEQILRPLTAKSDDEARLEQQIREAPGSIASYLALADLHKASERWDLAREVYAQALGAVGADERMRERIEHLLMEVYERLIDAAKLECQRTRSLQGEELYRKLRDELHKLKRDAYRLRAERNPDAKRLWAEHALRLQKDGFFREAIHAYEKVHCVEPRNAMILFGLAHCCEAEKLYERAMSYYREADAAISDSEPELKRELLYKLVRLAIDRKDLPTARECLGRLIDLDGEPAWDDLRRQVDERQD